MGKCSKKKTCDCCGGSGKVTVYTDSNQEHQVAVWLNDGREFSRPTRRVTCPDCNGSGTVYQDHDYYQKDLIMKKVGGLFGTSYPVAIFRCANCGHEVEWSADGSWPS